MRTAEIMVKAYAQAQPNDIKLKKSFIKVVAFCNKIKIKLITSRKIFGKIGCW